MSGLSSIKNSFKLKTLLIMPVCEKITPKTMPTAMIFVTYGVKNKVWKNLWHALIELINAEIIKAKIIETGTVTNVISKVFGSALVKNALIGALKPGIWDGGGIIWNKTL